MASAGKRRSRSTGAIVLCLLALSADARASDLFDETRGACTLFAFDTVSIPHTQNLRLEMRSPRRHPANPVLRRGALGSVDARGVQFYGSILREAGVFRMWYVAFDDDTGNPIASARWRPAYAESRDGVRWIKPALGLVEHGGTRANNLILIEPAPLGMVNLKVIADPEDPDPTRRYKIAAHAYFRRRTRLGTLAPLASADGLRWRLLSDAVPMGAELAEGDLVLPPVHFEPAGGLYKWRGMYHVCGQNAMGATHPYQGRVARIYRSPDFVHWSHTSAVAFTRPAQHATLGPGRSREGEQTHEGISVWHRGNVLLGVTGRWHGAAHWPDVTIDLGFVLSNDGLHFREPAHEWTLLRRGEDGQWDQGGLLQGQGFENVGDHTYLYYGAWDPRHREDEPERGGVGIATLPRDRFGDLVVDERGLGTGDYQLPTVTSELVTAAIPIDRAVPHRFHVNADGLGPEAALKIELLDERERGLPGFSGPAAALVRRSGFQAPIVWNGQHIVRGLPGAVRLHVVFEGRRRTDIRLSAIYLAPDPDPEAAQLLRPRPSRFSTYPATCP